MELLAQFLGEAINYINSKLPNTLVKWVLVATLFLFLVTIALTAIYLAFQT